MEKTLSNVDKGTRQDLILRVISERELGTQQDVVAALSDIGVEVAQATVSRDLAELGVLKVRNRYGTAGAVANVLDRVKGLKIIGTIAGQDTVMAVAPDNDAAEEVAELIADVCRARTRPAGNAE